ncbi:leucine-rich repeat and immunoglobulin-like domain-containing nogo receptor-interacting protein 1 [Acipenser ruthenus]|uniref:leucine-rich repeat and immunoglobulin-like domain-containing nogo receptor-interacting protein 1 n=1 Tax=Acipenser ruthenus TaxID=7906 RepID=UPI002740643B|nr:leucine-rich repeat and immunoglobulin-like domain-containing nogo receptor-interacting protein 1 [Acipenser ruthenus]XP_058862385.1 leucine-rich repeat and immunoglobulin-like domain-containing nogo receptor-interacting protein 1 [Acipenser ruthenus]XP_058862386.1 leucine-rich repeat and immunoglobulin-like domain-containing nogo receptor-interacting protein 1 [Acipenser ruthenus]
MIGGDGRRRRGVWLLLLLGGLAVALGGSLLSCPPKCECSSGKRTVSCARRRLTSVPENIPSDAELLDLSRNRLKSLSSEEFSNLPRLLGLDLSENIISAVEPGSFRNLPSLRTLRLRGNRLKILPVGLFSGLQSLRVLDLRENQILVFVDHTFRELSNLRQLEAGENDLVFLSHRAFSGLHNLQELTLDKCNLTSIPAEALSQLHGLLLLSLRRLGNVGGLQDLSFRRLQRLRSLEIRQCPSLGTLAGNSLLGLNLTSLSITGCNLSSVPYLPLRHLVYLRYLDLSHNPISVVQGHLLGDLLRLQEFHLAGGKLLTVEPGAFRGLTYFRLLNVSSNLLPTLEEGVFHSVGNLETLRLDGNPLACDCRLLWVVRRRLRLNFDGRQPSCSSPELARGREFKDFTESQFPGQFSCRRPQILDRKPQDVRIEEGNTVLFSCRADGDPAPRISWLTPQKAVLTPSGRVRVLLDGSLEVRYAQVQDGGIYQCVASNAAGNDSLPVSLQVRGFSLSSSAARNRSSLYFSDLQPTPFNASSSPGPRPYPYDAKTLVIATTMGFLSFLSSVAICFVFIFFWSRGKGKIKHNTTIAFVPRGGGGGGGGGGGEGGDGAKFSMKLM